MCHFNYYLFAQSQQTAQVQIGCDRVVLFFGDVDSQVQLVSQCCTAMVGLAYGNDLLTDLCRCIQLAIVKIDDGKLTINF